MSNNLGYDFNIDTMVLIDYQYDRVIVYNNYLIVYSVYTVRFICVFVVMCVVYQFVMWCFG